MLPEWLDEVERDFNHPSIIGWCPFNETWDIDGRRQCDEMIASVYRATKAADPTRPCIDTSGSVHEMCIRDRLGAADAFACDIDPQSIKVAKENTVLNSTPCVECAVSDLLSAVPEKKYDVVCANSVADVIIRLAPDVGAFMKDGAVLSVSGISSERADEVRAALSANGFEVDSDESENGWYCAAVKAKRDL